MISQKEISDNIILQLKTICKNSRENFNTDTQLVGEHRSIKSVELVELLLTLEEYVEEKLNAKFDWSGDSAMSQSRSILKNVESLSKHIFELQQK